MAKAVVYGKGITVCRILIFPDIIGVAPMDETLEMRGNITGSSIIAS